MKKYKFKFMLNWKYILLIPFLFSCEKRIEQKSKNNDFKKQIEGKWIVIESNNQYFNHPSGCDSLTVNSVYEFKNGNFSVFKTLDSKLPYNKYPQTYLTDSSEIYFCEIDMVIIYKIVKITKSELTLNSNVILPDYLDLDTNINNKMDFRKDGITIKLKRI